MKKIVLFVILAAVLIAAANPAHLTVRNRSAQDLGAYLYPITKLGGVSATPTLYAAVPAHSIREYSIPPGEYRYVIYACGQTFEEDVTIKGKFVLLMPSCYRLTTADQQRDGAAKVLPEDLP